MNDADMLADIRRRLPAARAALAHALGDMPAAGSGSGGGVSDRTGRLAIGVLEGRDGALTDSRRLDHVERVAITRLRLGAPVTRQLAEIIDILDRWSPTEGRRRALNVNLRAAADDLLNRHDDAGNCQSCKRLPGMWGTPHRRGLCKTCARHLDRVLVLYEVDLELPPRRLLEIARDRGKVTDQDIHAVMHGRTRRV